MQTGTPPPAAVVVGSDGKIESVRSTFDPKTDSVPGAETVDLRGRTLMPSLNDGHTHSLMAGLLAANKVSDETPDILRRDLQKALDAAPGATDGEWVIGSSGTLAGRQWTFRDLDALSTKRPIAVQSADGHSMIVNTAGLRAAGITRDTPDPSNGSIARDAAGEPTGIVRDGMAAKVLGIASASLPDDQVGALAKATVARLNRMGITTCLDIPMAWESARVWSQLEQAGELNVRARVALILRAEDWTEQTLSDITKVQARNSRGLVKVDTIKLFMDGVPENQTAAMLQPYSDGSNRAPFFELDRLRSMLTALDGAGWNVHIHACGDGAVRRGLDGFDALKGKRNPATRQALAHLYQVDAADLARFAALDVSACMSPQWVSDNSMKALRPTLGDARYDRLFPIGSLNAAGARITMGSDFPVEFKLEPWEAMMMAVTRKGPSDTVPLGLAEKVDLPMMLRAHTAGSAYQLGVDKVCGTIAEGKSADLIVLDRDIVRTPIEQVIDTKVDLTLLAGRGVYRR
ncbi:amidohydrolase [Nocardia colli]|nr:amidohydrolase [Nocardia colli]